MGKQADAGLGEARGLEDLGSYHVVRPNTPIRVTATLPHPPIIRYRPNRVTPLRDGLRMKPVQLRQKNQLPLKKM